MFSLKPIPQDRDILLVRFFSQRGREHIKTKQRNLKREQSLFSSRLAFTRPNTLYGASGAFAGSCLACQQTYLFKGLEGTAGFDLIAETSDSIQKQSQLSMIAFAV